MWFGPQGGEALRAYHLPEFFVVGCVCVVNGMRGRARTCVPSPRSEKESFLVERKPFISNF